MTDRGPFISLDEIQFKAQTRSGVKESLDEVRGRNFKIEEDKLPEIAKREHMARPYPGGPYDLLMINVPSSYQQGVIPDGEELPHGPLRVVATANVAHEMEIEIPGKGKVRPYPPVSAGILDAHRLRLQPTEIVEQIVKTGAKVVGLNPTSVNVQEAIEIAELCDKMGVKVILGGIHATLDPRIAREDFPNAAIVRGPGEPVINKLVHGLIHDENPRMMGVFYPGDDLSSVSPDNFVKGWPIDRIPLVDQRVYAEEPVYEHDVYIHGKRTKIREANLFETNGCPFDCTFCSSPVLVNRGVRGFKPYERPEMGRIITNVEHAVRDLGANAIHFLDDMAIVSPAHVRDLHRGMDERGLLGQTIWRGLTRAPVIKDFDPETMKLMHDSGCWKIALGVESGDDDMLKQIKKKVTTDDVRAAVDKLAAYDIQAKGFFIFGFPGETEEQMLRTLAFIKELKGRGMTEIAAFQFKPYPGTEDWKRVEESMPHVIPQLSYVRHRETGLNGKAQYRAESQNTWLPKDLKIADVPSGRVREIVEQALQDFYQPNNLTSQTVFDASYL